MQPVFYAALAWAAGIALAGWPSAWRFAWALPLAAAACLGFGRKKAWRPATLLLLALAGGSWYRWRADAGPPADSLSRTLAAWRPGAREQVLIGGYLRDDPQRGLDYTRFDLETEFLARGSQTASVSGGLRVYLQGPAAPGPPLRAGQAVEFAAHPRPLRRYLDPGVADFNRRARREGIGFTAGVAAAAIMPLPEIRGPAAARWRAALWRRLSAAVDQLAPPGPEPRLNALLRGMLLGDTSRLDPVTREDFQIDGIYHVLVVAGLHIGILALFFVWGLRRLGLSELWAGGLCLLLLAAYAWTIAGRTPTLRVLLMLAVYFIARAWYRQRQALNAVGTAALILLVATPAALFDAGFQMSFGAAVLLAGVVAPHFARGPRFWRRAARQLQDAGYDETFPPRWAQRRLELRAWSARLGELWKPLAGLPAAVVRISAGLYEVVVVAAFLQWGMAAFMAAYFHRATPWAALVNAAVVPAVGLLLPLAWALAFWRMLAGGWAIAGALAWVAVLPRALGRAILAIAHAAAAWPLAAAR
ncbi:MAG: ComEC/Rec2 family competence protein, partial [Terriglobales bacterium]